MSTQRRSLDALKSFYAPKETPQTNNQTQQFTNNYYPFWDMEAGKSAVIRFLPDKNEDNQRGFLVEKVTHVLTINGKERKIPCLSMYGEDCPICKISQEYYRAKDEINGKKYWKKRQYLGQALIVKDPLPPNAETGETHEGQVRMIALGFQIFNIIKESFGSDELEGIPYDFEEGYDFIIKKTETGGPNGKYASYTVGTKFANKQRALTEEEMAVAEEGMIDLATLLPKNPGFEKVQAMLNAEMNGEEYNDGSSSSDDSDSAPRQQKPATKPAEDDLPWETKTTAKPTVASTSEDGEDVDDMLAQIRARRKRGSAE